MFMVKTFLRLIFFSGRHTQQTCVRPEHLLSEISDQHLNGAGKCPTQMPKEYNEGAFPPAGAIMLDVW